MREFSFRPTQLQIAKATLTMPLYRVQWNFSILTLGPLSTYNVLTIAQTFDIVDPDIVHSVQLTL